MALYQQSVLNKYLKSLDEKIVKEAFDTYKGYFQKAERIEEIRGMKEEEYQDGFLDDLFVHVLGYIKKPNKGHNLERETKNVTNSKKADAALLKDKDVVAVIELKSTKTVDFSKIETQAFGYKRNHPKCVYVITSNFEKLRFYIQDAITPLEFNLFTLSESDFKLLYLCLAKDQLLADIPLKIKTESTIKEEDVTKKLYKDYSAFKRALFNDLVVHNPDYDKLILFKKSQKLIDRFLFIFFAEDKGLLPPNSIKAIVDKHQRSIDDDFPQKLITVFKQYFGYINSGRAKKGDKTAIFAYNGGLFAPDEILDQVNISDAVLKEHTLRLTAYDFETEIDVNILGHIFEHSLNEIDEMTAKLNSTGHDPLRKPKITKRKKDGVFYTPKYITKYIVDNTVGKLCEEKKTALGFDEIDFDKGYKIKTKRTNEAGRKTNISVDGEKILNIINEYRQYLLTLTICDPACGSGAFLNQALDFLIKEHHYIDELKTRLLGGSMVLSDVTNDILERNIYGVDINEESVDIARLSLWLRSAKPGRALTTLSSNIKCGNSLIDDPDVVGDKAFKWEDEFPDVFHKKEKLAFHVVLTTHNSRTSQRMKMLGIEKGDPIELGLTEEIELTKIMGKIIKDDTLHCLAYNICKDHVHLLLVCGADELVPIIQKLKSISSKLFHRLNIPMGHDPLKHKGLLWSKKFFRASLDEWELSTVSKRPGLIMDDTHLGNTIHYIYHNRAKHKLPISDELQLIIDSFTVDMDTAYADEYGGGFDVVIGNPPYGARISKTVLKHILLNQEEFGLNKILSDTYVAFYIKCLNELLRPEGLLSFITPNSWRLVQSGRKFRDFIFNSRFQVVEIIQHVEKVFKDATVDCDTLLMKKSTSVNNNINIKIQNGLNLVLAHKISQQVIGKQDFFNLFLTQKAYDLIRKINAISVCVKEHLIIKNGVKPYEKGKGKPAQTDEIMKEKPFTSQYKRDDSFSPLLGGSSFHRYKILWNNDYWIKYGKWLAAPRDEDIFKAPEKLIFRQTGDSLIGSLVNDDFIMRDNTHIILPKNNEFVLKYVLAVLNSKLSNFIYWTINPEKGEALAQIKLFHLGLLRIPKIKREKQQIFATKVDAMLQYNRDELKVVNDVLHFLQAKFVFKKISKRMASWHTLDSSGFIKELKKAKLVLGMKEEMELVKIFKEEQTKALSIKADIDRTDKEIDQMVYELYGLTDEEIAIVEHT